MVGDYLVVIFTVLIFVVSPLLAGYWAMKKLIGKATGLNITLRNPVVVTDKADKIKDLEAEIAELRKRGTARSGSINDATPEEWNKVKL